jgi:hypothetical protein
MPETDNTFSEIDSQNVTQPENRIISGFWRRLLAFALDGILIGVWGFIHQYTTKVSGEGLTELRALLLGRRGFLLRLLGNPNLLEHDSFTDMLWAVFHLTDELTHRRSVSNLLESDYKHLLGDMKRAYTRVVREWLDYMQHLSRNYPYLFSIAIRTNPFNPEASITVK